MPSKCGGHEYLQLSMIGEYKIGEEYIFKEIAIKVWLMGQKVRKVIDLA